MEEYLSIVKEVHITQIKNSLCMEDAPPKKTSL
jgi:hypothetical protein